MVKKSQTEKIAVKLKKMRNVGYFGSKNLIHQYFITKIASNYMDQHI